MCVCFSVKLVPAPVCLHVVLAVFFSYGNLNFKFIQGLPKDCASSEKHTEHCIAKSKIVQFRISSLQLPPK